MHCGGSGVGVVEGAGPILTEKCIKMKKIRQTIGLRLPTPIRGGASCLGNPRFAAERFVPRIPVSI